MVTTPPNLPVRPVCLGSCPSPGAELEWKARPPSSPSNHSSASPSIQCVSWMHTTCPCRRAFSMISFLAAFLAALVSTSQHTFQDNTVMSTAAGLAFTACCTLCLSASSQPRSNSPHVIFVGRGLPCSFAHSQCGPKLSKGSVKFKKCSNRSRICSQDRECRDGKATHGAGWPSAPARESAIGTKGCRGLKPR